MFADGDFYLENIGRRPIFIDGKLVPAEKKQRRLGDCSLIEVRFAAYAIVEQFFRWAIADLSLKSTNQ